MRDNRNSNHGGSGGDCAKGVKSKYILKVELKIFVDS